MSTKHIGEVIPKLLARYGISVAEYRRAVRKLQTKSGKQKAAKA